MIKEKIEKIKQSRFDKNELYFYNLTKNIKKEKIFFWLKVINYYVDDKCLFEIDNKNKTIIVLWEICETIIENGMNEHIEIEDFLLKMLKNHIGIPNIENYEIKYFT